MDLASGVSAARDSRFGFESHFQNLLTFYSGSLTGASPIENVFQDHAAQLGTGA
jgi:hypothetical protein